ncbi:hypothetical protein [uncultured Sphingomonas sp.]|uniref:hypothetical protein n=1 Tax=uncultured Sphingomonas sp. TaxID=158754 RepID=UPI0035C972E7
MLLTLSLVIAFLAGATDLKLGDIQGVEIAVVGTLVLSLVSTRTQLRLQGPTVVIDTLPRFLLLFLALGIGSLLSMRLPFYPIPNTGLLKQPPWATFVRLVEIIISVSTMFVITLAIGTRPENLKKVFTAYVWAAYVGAAWGIVSLVGWLAGIELPGATAGAIPRIRGFFVEGGPFGLYLVGALLIQFVRYFYLRYIGRGEFLIGTALLVVALAGAQSKSSIMLALLLVAAYLFVTKRLTAVMLLSPLVIPFVLTSNIVAGVNGYIESRERFSVLALTNPEDYNLVMGRVMASILMPRIVAEHPIIGIGIGNYSLVRNDPALLRGLPQVAYWDLPSLGLLGYLAELGVPLTIYVMYLYLFPFLQARKSRPWIAVLSIYPFGAALFGVQLNFAYPWIIMGMAFAALAIDASSRRLPSALGPDWHRTSDIREAPAGMGRSA